MQYQLQFRPRWMSVAILILLWRVATAYRPVQHCKRIFDNGQYSACTGLTQHYNATTDRSDLYVRYQWYRYKGSKVGWHAFGLGERMAGALMLVMYGDSTAEDGAMTVSIRSATGHHPPQPATDIEQYSNYALPEVEVVTSRFEKYSDPLRSARPGSMPSHVGLAEVIVRGFETWPGVSVSNLSTSQKFIWSSNGQQDMAGDYSLTRNLEAHLMGLGFGFLYVDLLNAMTPEPMFGPIDENAGLKGSSEVDEPTPPTDAELDQGRTYIQSMSTSALSAPDVDNTAQEDDKTATPPSSDKQQNNPAEVPAKTIFGKTLRDWMWHLHGLLMVLSFFVLYPSGVYLLRRPPESGTGFNSHWTMQALATVTSVIGASIGWYNSYSISVSHQYLGMFLLVTVFVQMFLGWRHHVIFTVTRARTWYSLVHMWSGRTILPLGFVNILLGMQLRRYGWFTILVFMIAMVLEAGFMIWVLKDAARNKRTDAGATARQDNSAANQAAEEYFQLTNEDDGFSDDGDQADGETTRAALGKREQAARLAKLDRV